MSKTPIEHQFRFCPRCGTQNEMLGAIPFKCVECGFSQFFGPVAAVGGLIVNGKGQLLLVRRARDPGKGQWGLPGGFVDRGESVEAALQREILEETQLHIDKFEFLMSKPNDYNYHGVVSPVIDLFFVCQSESSSSLQLAAEELEHFEWTRPREEHLANMAFESNRLAIQNWMQQQT